MKDVSVLGAPTGYSGNNAPVTPEAESQMRVQSTNKGNTSGASPDAVRVVRWGAAIVVASVILLWILGAIVFKDANL
jgi:hypothetical protein